MLSGRAVAPSVVLVRWTSALVGVAISGKSTNVTIQEDKWDRYTSILRHLRALGPHIHRIKRLAGSHEQPVLLGSSEAQIGAGLGQVDFPDQLAIWSKDVHPVEILRAPSQRIPSDDPCPMFTNKRPFFKRVPFSTS